MKRANGSDKKLFLQAYFLQQRNGCGGWGAGLMVNPGSGIIFNGLFEIHFLG
jgi:hypothetical protein